MKLNRKTLSHNRWTFRVDDSEDERIVRAKHMFDEYLGFPASESQFIRVFFMDKVNKIVDKKVSIADILPLDK